MDNTNSKILTLSFALAAAIMGFTVHLLVKSFSAAFGVVARLADSDMVRHGFPVVFGLAVFAILQFNPRVLAWGEDVVGEIRKVVWPGRKDVTSMTIVVLIMVLISSVIISSFDLTSGAIMKWIMSQ
ncbi:MAG: preprotein translocase subunit SecE [Bdellovibrio sp. CG10_big_fil_rev_8_21_14_0_10_47_8]|nr:MAG: preprotein translocase subunit SecE [Bdellovibrio sp. CG10_big_fil_rev_8_21_14_0_10_47_8]